MKALRGLMWAAVSMGIFLAFGWPFVFGPDPGSGVFHAVSVATVLALFGSIGAVLAAKR